MTDVKSTMNTMTSTTTSEGTTGGISSVDNEGKQASHLRIAMAGNVDAGKSTLVSK